MSKLYAVLDAFYLNRISEFPGNGFDGIREGAIELDALFPNKPVLKPSNQSAYLYDVTTGGVPVNWTAFDQQCVGVKAQAIDLLLTSFYNGSGGDWDSKALNGIGNPFTYTSAATAPQSATDYGARHPSPKDQDANVLAVLAKVSRAINYHGIPASRILLDGYNEYTDRQFGGQGSAMTATDGTGSYAGYKVGNYTFGASKATSTYMQFEVQQLASAIARAVKAAFPAVKLCAPSFTKSPLDLLPSVAQAQVWGMAPANLIDPLTGGVADCFGLADYLNLHSYIHAMPATPLGIDPDTLDARLTADDQFAKAGPLREAVLAQLESCIQAADAVPGIAGKAWCVSEFGQSFTNYGSKLNRFFMGELLDEFAQTYESHPRVSFAAIYTYVDASDLFGLIPLANKDLYIGNGGTFDQGKHEGYYRIRERRRGTLRAATVTYPPSLV